MRVNHYWQSEIIAFRTQLESKLTTNLKKHLQQRWEYLYSKAKKIAETKSGVKMSDNPYSLEEVLEENFLP
ncbi:MAG: DUF29 family protein [Xenococcaceae cyanobacterium]